MEQSGEKPRTREPDELKKLSKAIVAEEREEERVRQTAFTEAKSYLDIAREKLEKDPTDEALYSAVLVLAGIMENVTSHLPQEVAEEASRIRSDVEQIRDHFSSFRQRKDIRPAEVLRRIIHSMGVLLEPSASIEELGSLSMIQRLKQEQQELFMQIKRPLTAENVGEFRAALDLIFDAVNTSVENGGRNDPDVRALENELIRIDENISLCLETHEGKDSAALAACLEPLVDEIGRAIGIKVAHSLRAEVDNPDAKVGENPDTMDASMKEKPEKPIPGSARDVREHTPPPRPIVQGIDIEKLTTTASEPTPKSLMEETKPSEKEGVENGAEKMNAELLAAVRTEQKRVFESAVSAFTNDPKPEGLKALVEALTPLKETFQAEAHYVGKDGASQSRMNKKVAAFAKMMADLAGAAAAGTEDAVKDAIIALRKGAELFGASVSLPAGETAGTRSASEQPKKDLTERIKALLPAEGKIILEDRGKPIQVEPTEMAVIIERHVSNILTKSEARIPGYILDVAEAIKDETLARKVQEFLFDLARKEGLLKERPLIKNATTRAELIEAAKEAKNVSLNRDTRDFKAGPIEGPQLALLAQKLFEECSSKEFLDLTQRERREKAEELASIVDLGGFRLAFIKVLEKEGAFAIREAEKVPKMKDVATRGELIASAGTLKVIRLHREREGFKAGELKGAELAELTKKLLAACDAVPAKNRVRKAERLVEPIAFADYRGAFIRVVKSELKEETNPQQEGDRDQNEEPFKNVNTQEELLEAAKVLRKNRTVIKKFPLLLTEDFKRLGSDEKWTKVMEILDCASHNIEFQKAVLRVLEKAGVELPLRTEKKDSMPPREERGPLTEQLERERQIFGKVKTFDELKSAIHAREKAYGPFQISGSPYPADTFVAYLERYFALLKRIDKGNKRMQALEPLLAYPIVPNTVYYQKALKKALESEGISTKTYRQSSPATYNLEPEGESFERGATHTLDPEGKYEEKEHMRAEKNKEAKEKGVEAFFKDVRTWRGLWDRLKDFEDKAAKEPEGEKRDRAVGRARTARSGCVAAYRELQNVEIKELTKQEWGEKVGEICAKVQKPFDGILERVATSEFSLNVTGTKGASKVESEDKDKTKNTMETAPGGASTTEKPKEEEKKTEAPKAEEKVEVLLSDTDKKKASKDFDLGKVQKDPKFMEFLGKLSNMDEIINAPAGLEKLYNNFQKKEQIMDAIQEIHAEDFKKRLGIEIASDGFADMQAFIEKKVATDPRFIASLEKQITAYQVKKKREATMEDKVAKTSSEGNYHNEFAKLKEVKKEKEALSLLKLSSRPIIGRLVRWYHTAGKAWENAFSAGPVEKWQEFLEENQKKIDDANEALEINKNDKKAKADLEYALQKKREAQTAIADLTSSTRFMQRLDEAKGLAAEKGWGNTKQELSAKIKEKRKEFKEIRKGVKEIRKRRNELYGKQGEIKEIEQEIFERGFPTAALFKAAQLRLQERVKTLLDPKNASFEDIAEANRLLEEAKEMGEPREGGAEDLMSSEQAQKVVEAAMYRSFKEALAEGEEKAYEKAALAITRQLTPIYKKGEIRDRLKQTFERLDKDTASDPGRRAAAGFLKRTLQRKFGKFTA